jgi:hypothetical protein
VPIGTFLMRDSIRDFDQKVLCVKYVEFDLKQKNTVV